MSSVALDNVPNPDADGLVGSVAIWPVETLPSAKYQFAEGQAVSRTEFALLFSRYGTKHGTGDGSTTFNLPDYRKKFLVGVDESDAAYDEVGATGGSASGSVSGTTSTDGAHTHTVSGSTGTDQGGSTVIFPSGSTPVSLNPHTHTTITGTAASNGDHSHSFSGTADTVPPYNVVRFIVKVM
jgi:microcystin-dependent protein